MNELLQYINTHLSWKTDLAAAPYFLRIKQDGDYIICNYSQFESDFSNPIVQEARGHIFYLCGDKAEYVCRPFKKFFNYGESAAESIDWSSAYVTEKIDGSLMKVWFHKGKWHLSTNGTIDAFKTNVNDLNLTFGDLFEQALGYDVQKLGSFLNPTYTYCFELTTPESRVVISYPSQVWLLTAFNTKTGQEIDSKTLGLPPCVRRPRVYLFNKLDTVLACVEQFDNTHEGVVVADKFSHRIKIKSAAYLALAHSMNRQPITNAYIIERLRDGTLDDIIGVYPGLEKRANDLRDKMIALVEECAKMWRDIMRTNPSTRAEFAAQVKEISNNSVVSSFLFKKYDNPALDEIEWVLSVPTKKILQLIGE